MCRIGFQEERSGLRWRRKPIILCILLIWLSPTFSCAQRSSAETLLSAIQNREPDRAIEIIKAGGAVDFRDSQGRTPQNESIVEDLPVVTKELVSQKADLSLGDIKGITPLMYAAWYCRLSAAKVLLSAGAPVNASDSDGYSALMYAASHCTNGEVVGLLLRSGAKVNVRGADGQTALILAAFNGDDIAVSERAVAGADISVRNSDGATALTVASDRVVGRKPSHDNIAAYLRSLTVVQQSVFVIGRHEIRVSWNANGRFRQMIRGGPVHVLL